MHAPSHTTVVSYLALFMALGGSAYAATGGGLILGHANTANHITTLKTTGSGPALRLTASTFKPTFAVSNSYKIAKLNADFLDGDSANEFARKGFGIASTMTSADSGALLVGPNGLWTFSLTCASGGPATLTINGPGTVGGTIAVATGTGAATSYIREPIDIGTSYQRAASDGQELSLSLLLHSGGSFEKVDAVLSASSGGLFETCQVFGAVVPVT